MLHRALAWIVAGGFCLAVSLYFGPEPAKAALVSYWNFNGNFNDSVGSNNGTAVGGAAIVNNVDRGDVLSLNGTTGYVDAGTDSSLDFGTNNFTVVAWFTTTSTARQRLISRDLKVAPFTGYEIETAPSATANGPNTIRTAVDGGAPNRVVDYVTPDDDRFHNGQWHHVAMVVEGVGQVGGLVRLYYDGVEVGTGDIFGIDSLASGANPFLIGVNRRDSSGSDTFNQFWNGLVDDVAVWSDALPASSIAGLANGTYTPLTTPIPEPGSMILAAMSLAGVFAGYRLRKRS